ncbi:MFS family permease [Paenochrobactrum gallinarii]|uniref:MFS family permease n=1 Tax=Paenochrobactrum gallinarii TaxID=643673 RepID=A0A841LX04_9HYPH|nr:MFS transporter [Paenochrobactrum gallinarii]MBB6261390.1 MFS family permease [Paenochrobactrum gallinarii]
MVLKTIFWQTMAYKKFAFEQNGAAHAVCMKTFYHKLADRFPKRKMFAIGLVLFDLASLAAVLAPNYQVLASICFLQGIGGALLATASIVLINSSEAPWPDFHAWDVLTVGLLLLICFFCT